MVDECHSTKKFGTVTPRVSTNTNTQTAAKTPTAVPMDVSQMSSNVSKLETEEHHSVSYQYEQDQECDGDEVYVVKGKGKGGSKGICVKCGMRGHEVDRCWQRGKRKRKQGGLGERKKVDPNGDYDPKENCPMLVTRGTVLGTIHTGTGKRRVLRWIRGRLSNLFHISVRSVPAQVARSCRNRNA